MSESFAEDGFVVLRNVLDSETVRALNDRLRAVLDGKYDRGNPPDKCPRSQHRTTESRNNGEDLGGRRVRDDCDATKTGATGTLGAKAERTRDLNSGNIGSSGIGGREDGGNGRGALAGKVGQSCEEAGGGTSMDQTGAARREVENATRMNESSNPSRRGGKKIAGKGRTKNHNNDKVRVVQVINVHKSDSLFRSLAVSTELGRVVSDLVGWSGHGGARLAQDQVWAKPPGSPPLTYHRDSPYFMFTLDDVVTVWVALDDMDEELGPLEYVRGSHRWTDGGEGVASEDDRAAKGRGSASRFFPADRGVGMLRRAAEAAGDRPIDLVSMSKLRAGDISIHHGKTWHGSGPNLSKERWRRGLGLHYVPRDVRFTEEAVHSSLWRKYVVGHEGVGDIGDIELDEEDFPVVWNS